MKVRLCADLVGKYRIMLDGRQVPSQRPAEVEGYQHGLSSCAYQSTYLGSHVTKDQGVLGEPCGLSALHRRICGLDIW